MHSGSWFTTLSKLSLKTTRRAVNAIVDKNSAESAAAPKPTCGVSPHRIEIDSEPRIELAHGSHFRSRPRAWLKKADSARGDKRDKLGDVEVLQQSEAEQFGRVLRS